jgi:hypothetical protein
MGAGICPGEAEHGCAAGGSWVDAVADEDPADCFGRDGPPGLASREQPGGLTDAVGGGVVVVDVVEHDGADHGRELDGDFVEGDDDSPVGGLGDLVAGHP